MSEEPIPFDEFPTTSTTVQPILNNEVSEFVSLDGRQRELEAELERIKKRKSELEKALLDGFAKSEIRNISMSGVTVYVHRQLWANAKDGDYERTCAALRKAGLGDLVHERFNSNTLSAYFRELDKQGEVAVPELADSVELTEKFSIRTRAR